MALAVGSACSPSASFTILLMKIASTFFIHKKKLDQHQAIFNFLQSCALSQEAISCISCGHTVCAIG
jgi:stress-induced morphogen